MKLKKVIALICLFIMATQMLPVKQIGLLLFGNQVNEELSHVENGGKDDISKVQFKSDFFLTEIAHHHILNFQQNSHMLRQSNALPHNHSSEIPTPPPDFI